MYRTEGVPQCLAVEGQHPANGLLSGGLVQRASLEVPLYVDHVGTIQFQAAGPAFTESVSQDGRALVQARE
jgi:hypothetical protein